ncbi:lipopolysaccharide assembly outer membrane protein LptD (OstA) [Elusimicrobium simillimum]|uniref:hypothetical protein n=1 Tax=Elusimicrobium simillimum TaxID=3143438 RepID=UPI003C6F1338
MKRIFSLILASALVTPLAAQQLPPGLLGGMLKSDKWIVKRDKQQEEFIGNVSYQSKFYKLKADRAVSDRAKDTFTIFGNTYLMNKDADGKMVEMYSDNAKFTNFDRKAYAEGGDSMVNIIYTVPGEYKIDAKGKHAYSNTTVNSLKLWENATMTYTTEDDFIVAFADSFYVNQTGKVIFLEGNVELDNKNYTAFADYMSYNGFKQLITAEKNYPLFLMDNEDMSGALQADYVEVKTNTKFVRATGRVRGWVTPKE